MDKHIHVTSHGLSTRATEGRWRARVAFDRIRIQVTRWAAWASPIQPVMNVRGSAEDNWRSR